MKLLIKRSITLILCLSFLMGTWIMPLGTTAAKDGRSSNYSVTLSDYSEQVQKYHSNIFGAEALEIYSHVVNLGTIDLSQYAAVRITYSFDGSDTTKGYYDSSEYHSLGLSKTEANYGTIGSDPDYSQDIAHGEMAFSSTGMGDFRTMEIDLTDVDYNGDVYLTQYRFHGGTCILVFGIEFVTASGLVVPIQVSPVLEGYKPAVSQLSDSEGMLMNMAAPFVGVEFRVATYLVSDLDITLSLYEWKKNYEDTVRAQPMAEERIRMKDNDYIGITFDELPAGQYLALLHDASGKSAVYYYAEAQGLTGVAFKDAAQNVTNTQYLQCRVTFTQEAENGVYFLPCDDVEDSISDDHAAPPEYTIPADSLLNTHKVMPDTWVFTDGLGRVSLTNADVGDPRDDKTLAMFFWIWHGSGENPRVNLQQLSEKYPDAMRDYDNPLWSQLKGGYSWNESIYGFYSSTDEWVLRRQAELLANAGVDVIFSDNTNGTDTWKSAYTQLMNTWDNAQKNGAVHVPKVSFILPFSASDDSRQQFNSLYLDIYRPGKWQNLWYYQDGKPMILGYADNLSATESNAEKEILNFFTFRKNYAAYTNKKPEIGSWGWLSTFPQTAYYGDRSDVMARKYEQISVSVAQNYNYKLGLLAAMNGDSIMGRSYTSKGYHTEEGAKLWGYNFAEQFDYALEVDPQVVFITGWNEWMVGRYETWLEGSDAAVENAFPDQFNDEYSRDIEPSKGDLKDHYYYQLVNYARRYKGVNPIPTPSVSATIDMNAGADQWNTVEPYYAAYIGNTDDRNAQGYGQVYTETSGRNDIIGAQIARDDQYVYFHVECAENITPYTDKLWMNLYLDTDQSNQGWNTFEYVLNKSAASADTLVLERFTAENDYSATTKVADVEYAVDGRYMTVKIAKSDLGLSGDNYTINFSWTDNVHDEDDYSKYSGDIMDFYISGDVAPGGRFKYSYISTAENAGYGETETTPDTSSDTTPDTNPDESVETVLDTDIPENEVSDTDESETDASDQGGCKSVMVTASIWLMMTVCALCFKKKKQLQNSN